MASLFSLFSLSHLHHIMTSPSLSPSLSLDMRPSPTPSAMVEIQQYPPPTPSPTVTATPIRPKNNPYSAIRPYLHHSPPGHSPKGCPDMFALESDTHLANLLRFDKEIGYGNWGSVWRVNNNKAVKLIWRNKQDKTTPARERSIRQEYLIIRSFRHNHHPNIIKFYN